MVGDKSRTMHFLLTNDDGIHAAGLEALAAAVSRLPDAMSTIVAPVCEYSQCGHRVTTREPIYVERRGERRFAVSGTPADCVRMAVFGLGIQPDYVVSGVNHGGNMGQDIVISGTVAAVREAAYHGIPAAAFSHYLIKQLDLDWPRVADWTVELLKSLLGKLLKAGEFWNVNFPHLPPGSASIPEVVYCQPAMSPLKVAYESVPNDGESQSEFRYTGVYASRPRDPGSDVEACFNGRIAVSRLSIQAA